MIIKCSKMQFIVLFLLDSCCIMIIVPPFAVHSMKNSANSPASWHLC